MTQTDQASRLNLLERRLAQALEEFEQMRDFVIYEQPDATGTIVHLKSLVVTYRQLVSRSLAPGEDDVRLVLDNGWVCEQWNHCTCNGPSAGVSAHEIYCGLVPLMLAHEWMVTG